MSAPVVLLGLPYLGGALPDSLSDLPALVSVGSLFSARSDRAAGFQRIPGNAWVMRPALDSAGFTAMRLGGYRWTPADYVEFVATNRGDGGMPLPWRWWSAMDYCCEEEIATDRAEVERRMSCTIDTYGEMLEACEAWRREGVSGLPDPVPVLQGRLPADYLASAERLARVIDQRHACTCPAGQVCAAEWHREHAGLPQLVGVGSVCRRQVHGPDGLLAVVGALHAALPAHVRLHLFGVKGSALPHLARFGSRVESVDSMAWDMAVRRTRGPSDVATRTAAARAWLAAQVVRPAQVELFGVP